MSNRSVLRLLARTRRRRSRRKSCTERMVGIHDHAAGMDYDDRHFRFVEMRFDVLTLPPRFFNGAMHFLVVDALMPCYLCLHRLGTIHSHLKSTCPFSLVHLPD